MVSEWVKRRWCAAFAIVCVLVMAEIATPGPMVPIAPAAVL